MNIIEATKELQTRNPSATVVRHYQGEEWEIDQLLSVWGGLDEGQLAETSDGGEWVADDGGIYRLDDRGYRTGERYEVIG